MRTTLPGRVASVIVGAEGLCLAVLAGVQIAAIAAGDTGSAASAVALVVLLAVGAASVLAFAVAIWRGLSWGRSGGIVTQILIFAVAVGAATGAYAHPLTGVILAVPAVVTFALLLVATRDAGRAKPRDSDAA